MGSEISNFELPMHFHPEQSDHRHVRAALSQDEDVTEIIQYGD
jgi:hypothetical protein